MPQIPRMPRRRPPIKERSHEPSFLIDEFAAIKQEQREVTAAVFAEHLHGRPDLLFMPYYYALCAKAVHERLPDAALYGVEYYKNVAENVDEVGGKKLIVYKMSVQKLVNHPDQRRFDGAFLDFMGKNSASRAQVVVQFVKTKMHRGGVLAMTMQEGEQQMDQLYARLQDAVPTVRRVYCCPYQTKTAMCHAIFLLEN